MAHYVFTGAQNVLAVITARRCSQAVKRCLEHP